ncbi:DUF1176 domain-containing protein [Curvibacter sp. HBC61]|uniref:DUF1176 domain-containing protein n=1 Tax=Curvibacter cyanobacteriorum TaxID=3026422 RepID=A0ABT5MWW3_9BURK|nr:DUF1176 domain-containing protein [Curvibacter sp. HBC61]MDD0838544.1 DUF1176 domain-containing protein [Curvibacter sp. HBC61]
MKRYLLALLCAASAWAGAAPPVPKPVQFSHGHWSVLCDNSRTCRAEGYQADEADPRPVSMLLTRAAGPDTPVQVEWQVYSEPATKGPLRLSVGAVTLTGQGEGVQTVPAAQVPALLREMLKADAATVRGAQAAAGAWRLSLAGLNAVLLKMDDVQGRVDTPGALVRPGKKPESAVPPAPPVPQLKAAKLAAPRAADAGLLRPLLAALPTKVMAEECNDSDLYRTQSEVVRLTDRQVLLVTPCPQGAYNGTSLLWLANDRPPYQLQLQDANGDLDPKTGRVVNSMKGRGLGDCWSQQAWQFDGQAFVLAREASTGECRGFPGGAWDLPSYVTR